MRRKKCRAAACPRKVDDNRIFCNVHFAQLTPQLSAPIVTNTEPPLTTTPTERGRIIRSTRKAVAFLAKKEGRSEALATAQRATALDAGQGGAGDATTTSEVLSESREITPRGTERYDLR